MYRRDFQEDKPVGRDGFADIINRHNLKVRQKVRKPRTTDSSHGLPTYPNLIRDFIPSGPDQLWVSDITYIIVWPDESHYKFCYLSLIMDVYTEEIVGWSVGLTLEATYPVEALKPKSVIRFAGAFSVVEMVLSGRLPASVRILFLATPRRSPLRLWLGEKHAA